VFLFPLWFTLDGYSRFFDTRIATTNFNQSHGISRNAIWLSVFYAWIALPHALFIIAAALCLRNGRAYWFAVAACVLAALPITLVFPVGLPIALWGLAVLTSQDVRAVFAGKVIANPNSPEERLHWSALGLIVAGVVDGAVALFFAVALVLYFVMLPEGATSAGPGPGVSLVFGVPALSLAIMRLAGGIKMLRLRGPYWFVTLASVVSLLPVSWGSILGIPACIWALVVLVQSDVKQAIARTTQRVANAPPSNRASEEVAYSAGRSAVDFEHEQNTGRPDTRQHRIDLAPDDEQQRAAELAERPPGWLAFVELGIFGIGWLFVGAMWNFGTPGLYFAFAVLATIVYLSVRWNLAYLPKLQRELLRQSRLRRGFALMAGLIIFLVAMIFVTSAQTSWWDMVGNPTPVLSGFNEQHDQLLTAAKSAKLGELNEKAFNVQTVGPMSYRSRWEPLYCAAFGMLFVVVAVGVVVDTRRYRNSWKYCWGTAVAVAVLLFTMLFIIVPIFMPKGTSRPPRREVRSAAPREQLQMAVQTWGKKNGYVVDVQSSGGGNGGGERALRLAPVEKLKPEDFGPGFAKLDDASTSKDGKQYVIKGGQVWEQVWEKFHDKFEVVKFRLLRPSALDQYHTSWHGTYRPRPPLTVTCVTKTSTRSERIHQSYGPETTTINTVAHIEPTWEWMGTPESMLWTPILDDLEGHLGAVAQMEKASEPTKRTD
jgi:hypothetical protein